MLRTEAQDLATCPTPLLAKPLVWRKEDKTRPWGVSGFIPGMWGWERGKETEDTSPIVPWSPQLTGARPSRVREDGDVR